jgi:hypothetical protein
MAALPLKKSWSPPAMLRLALLSMLLLSACIPQAATSPTVPVITPVLSASLTSTPTETSTPPPSLTPTLVLPLTPTPGLVLQGRVHLADGAGLAGVAICRNYASYPGVIVATTGADGTFQSNFAFIPGDEMVGVWPLAAGYQFEPPFVRWRHYYSFEDRILDFVASPISTTAVPPTPCS